MDRSDLERPWPRKQTDVTYGRWRILSGPHESGLSYGRWA